jgi:NADP-dependent 3-hydroxy acid dehydrogenase YdfG
LPCERFCSDRPYEGIGFAIARALNNAGANVVLNGRAKQKVDAGIARLGRARGHAFDLAPRTVVMA